MFYVLLTGMSAATNETKKTTKKKLQKGLSESSVRRKCSLLWRLGAIRWTIKVLSLRAPTWSMIIRGAVI